MFSFDELKLCFNGGLIFYFNGWIASSELIYALVCVFLQVVAVNGSLIQSFFRENLLVVDIEKPRSMASQPYSQHLHHKVLQAITSGEKYWLEDTDPRQLDRSWISPLFVHRRYLEGRLTEFLSGRMIPDPNRRWILITWYYIASFILRGFIWITK